MLRKLGIEPSAGLTPGGLHGGGAVAADGEGWSVGGDGDGSCVGGDGEGSCSNEVGSNAAVARTCGTSMDAYNASQTDDTMRSDVVSLVDERNDIRCVADAVVHAIRLPPATRQ